jgi:hypothetical protein
MYCNAVNRNVDPGGDRRHAIESGRENSRRRGSCNTASGWTHDGWVPERVWDPLGTRCRAPQRRGRAFEMPEGPARRPVPMRLWKAGDGARYLGAPSARIAAMALLDLRSLMPGAGARRRARSGTHDAGERASPPSWTRRHRYRDVSSPGAGCAEAATLTLGTHRRRPPAPSSRLGEWRGRYPRRSSPRRRRPSGNFIR